MKTAFEIRVCNSCGLRYPILEGHSFGVRCPHCLGETIVVLKKEITRETRRKRAAKRNGNSRAVLLDNIRSAWNVGAIFRSAEGFGFSHAHVCGITPTPDVEAVRKTSLGAEKSVRWTYHKSALAAARELKSTGHTLLALEEDKKAVALQNASMTGKVVLILGSEVTGVDPELLDLCDQIAFIPMQGRKKSFNVSAAFAIAAYALAAKE